MEIIIVFLVSLQFLFALISSLISSLVIIMATFTACPGPVLVLFLYFRAIGHVISIKAQYNLVK